MKIFQKLLCALILALTATVTAAAAADPARVTVISDAFGKPSDLARSWGYSALVEYGGRRILFDTGGQYEAFKRNVRALNIDLTKLDFVILSHRHGDHTSGLAYVLEQNPRVKIYAPAEAGSFGNPVVGSAPLGKLISRNPPGTPDDLRYFGGKYADKYSIDSPWPKADITLIDKTVEVLPGFFLFRTVSENKGTLELNELSMAVKTPKGLAVVVGCSHPGIEKILGVAAQIDSNIYTVFGGLHLVDVSDQDVVRIVDNFSNKWRIQRVAAGHCAGEFAQNEFARVYGTRHDHSGLGEVIALPQ